MGGCGSKNDVNQDASMDNFKYKGTEIPKWKAENKSLLKKCLTQDVWDQLKDKQDSFGCTLGHIINSGVKNEDSGIGVYAGGPETYTVFAPLLDKIIESYHGLKTTDNHASDWDVSKLTFEPLEDKYCVSTRIRVARNLQGFPFGTFITPDQRKQVEDHAKKAFASMTGELKGTYYPLGGLSEADRKQLIADHFLFKEGDRFLQTCGLNRQWPDSRGIYHNDDKTFLCWVNEEDQFRIISMQEGGDIKAVFERLANGQKAIESVAKFSFSPHLGYLTTCPTNVGTGLRASIHVKLPKISKQHKLFEQIAAENNVQVRGIHGEHSESDTGVYDISNKRRIGFTEVQLTWDMYNGVKALIDAEKSIPDSPDQHRYTGDEIPKWKPENKSLLRKCLTPDVWTALKDKKDSFGCTLGHIINSGVKNEDSGIGVYAGGPETYTAFAPLMDKIIENYHGLKTSDNHTSDWDVSKLTFPEPLDDRYCVSTRIRVARNLEGYPFGTFITPEQRKEVEEHAKKAFSQMSGELKGTYYPLGGLSKPQRKQLIADHFLFKEGDRFLETCGLNRQWPDSRGIFHNDAKTFLCWVNEEDQFRIISMQNGGDIKSVFERLAEGQKAIESVAKFSFSPHLGYLTTCPTNVGTGLRASIHVKLPKISKQKERFEKIAAQNNVQVRGIHGEHSESDSGVYDISNKRRIGFTEVQLTWDMYNGVKALIEAEKSIPDSPDLHRYTGKDIPNWKPDNKSLLKKCLTPDVWKALKDKKDSFGCTLGHIINSGVKNEDSGIGVYAGGPETYTVFAPLMDKIIESYHGLKTTDNHTSDWDVSKLSFPEPLDDSFCVSTRIRVARNLAGFPFGTFITPEQRKQVEENAKKAFASMEGELKGTYYPLGGLSEANRKQLIADHFLFKEGDRFLETCGLNRQWPDSRGIFHNDNKTFLCWVNEEDQFRIISMQSGGDIKAVFQRLANGQKAIESVAKFSFSSHLGYLTTCPTNVGTGLRASIHVKLPKISKQKERFEKIAAENNVQVRGIHGEHSESDSGVYDISNKRRIGFTEVQLTWDMYNGVKALIEAEKSL